MARSANNALSQTPDTLRESVLLEVDPALVQNMLPSQLVRIQNKLGFGNTYGVWETPREWMPAGSRKLSLIRIDFRARLLSLGVSNSHLDNVILYCARYAVLLALVPSASGKSAGNRILKPSTLVAPLYRTLPHIIALSFSPNKNEPKKHNHLHLLTNEDLQYFSPSKRKEICRELVRINKFCDLKLWPDRPSNVLVKNAVGFIPQVSGADIRPTVEPRIDKYLPLPDDWIAESGWRALWLVKDLGPNLLSLGQKISQIIKEAPHLNSGVSTNAVRQKRRRRVLMLMNDHQWIDRHGNNIERTPFPLTVRVGANTPALLPEQWPPTHATHVLKLLEYLQSAHLFVAFCSIGSRISEMLSLKSGAVIRSPDNTPFLSGLTYKLAHNIEGTERDWPLPEIALEAINQQERLANVLREIGFFIEDSASGQVHSSDSLWVRYGNSDELNVTGLNASLRALVRALGLEDKPGGQSLSSHRFRKTIARLVALAVVGAPKILMDLFGHKSIEMTLYYILTDPVISAEVKKISEEMTVMRAVTAINDIDNYGGRAVKPIKQLIDSEKFRLGKDLGANNIRELAEILTLNGQAWELSRPGVICTKLPASSSPCAKKVGHPEPSRCQPSCDNRLEEAYLRTEVDGAIAESIQHFEAERIAGNSLMQDFWAGQVLAHLHRFEDLRCKWISHPSIQDITSQQAQSA